MLVFPGESWAVGVLSCSFFEVCSGVFLFVLAAAGVGCVLPVLGGFPLWLCLP